MSLEMSDYWHDHGRDVSLNPDGQPCSRCGLVAEGHAFIGDDRYCHGNERPSCYEREQWEQPVPDAIKDFLP